MDEEFTTYYDSGLIESKEIIKKGGLNDLIVFNEKGDCTYSSTEEYETVDELKLHRDYFLKRY